jgi:YozE SAM-like fold
VWLRRQQRRQDAVGDLARDQRQDDRWPRGPASLARLERYLMERHASARISRALAQAWHEWKQE